MEDKIQRLVNAANSTNATAKEFGMKGLKELGLDNNGNTLKSASIKEPKPKAERKKREPKAKAEVKSGTPYDCDDLIAKAEERKAKAKANAVKRANEPKKTQATKNVEAVDKTAERVEKNVEKRVVKGEVSVAEIDKIIAEYETALKKLRALREKATSKMAKGGGVDAEEVEHILMKAQGVKEHHCGCGDKKMATGGNVSSEISKVKSSLIARAKSKGISENFGQNEVRKLEDKYGYTKEVQAFDDWAMNYDGRSMATGGGVGESEEVYIEFMNKDKGFKVDRKSFKSYEEAKKWASKNFERFNPDMIKYK